jgi:hypothetical protein
MTWMSRLWLQPAVSTLHAVPGSVAGEAVDHSRRRMHPRGGPPFWLQAKARLVRAHAEVADTLATLYTTFAGDSEEVQREWVRFTQKVGVCAWLWPRGVLGQEELAGCRQRLDLGGSCTPHTPARCPPTGQHAPSPQTFPAASPQPAAIAAAAAVLPSQPSLPLPALPCACPQVDRQLQEALRSTIKRSLQALARMLNGDSKTEVLPIFRVTLVRSPRLTWRCPPGAPAALQLCCVAPAS